MHPLNFGWKDDDNGRYVPIWFEGEAFLENISYNGEESESEIKSYDTETDVEDDHEVNDKDDVEFDKMEFDSQPWSSDSESEYD